MTVKEIVRQWLQDHGYDGLCSDFCGCVFSDLMPCGEDASGCQAGYKVPCPGPQDCEAGGTCPWHIRARKKNEQDSEEARPA